MGVETDPQVLKRVYDRGYSACIYGEPRKSPYNTTYQLWANVEWKKGYDDAKKKHRKKYTKKKFDMGNVVESPKPRPSQTSDTVVGGEDRDLWKQKETVKRKKEQSESL